MGLHEGLSFHTYTKCYQWKGSELKGICNSTYFFMWSNTRPGATVHTNIVKKLLPVAQEGKHFAINVLNFLLIPQVGLRLSVFFLCLLYFIHSVTVHIRGCTHWCHCSFLHCRVSGKMGKASLLTMAPVYTLPDWDGKHARRGAQQKCCEQCVVGLWRRMRDDWNVNERRW